MRVTSMLVKACCSKKTYRELFPCATDRTGNGKMLNSLFPVILFEKNNTKIFSDISKGQK